MIKVAVLGYGTVGSGVVEVIEQNKEQVNKKAGDCLEVKYILDLRDFPGDPYENKVVHDFNVIVDDPEVQIVCETMGGTGAAYKFTKACLEAGKSVCTSNKALVAEYGPELLKIAEEKNCNYLFEASVGGGIPIIRTLNSCLTAERIEAIVGILNGTTNYMLSKMEKEGAEYADVLKKAQEKGYAEADPTADVEGYDACRKIAILSSLMTGKNVNYEKISTQGITHISAMDFEYAKAAGKSIKLLAISKLEGEQLLAMVAPAMIDKESPLSMINGVFNGVLVTGNMLGDSMYYGKGAGKLPTASAVVGDVVECAKHLGKNIKCHWDADEVELVDVKKSRRAFYVRAQASAMNEIKKAIPNGEVVQLADYSDEFAYFTPVMVEEELDRKLEAVHQQVLSVIRLA